MNPNAATTPIYLRDLQLATAQALVVQDAGVAVATEKQGPVHYLQGLIDGLCELSLKDPLTGLANRRFLHSTLEREIDRVTRSGDTALLLMVDIDHFKSVNDAHGHLAGDLVLQSVARTLSTCVRPMDTVARYGGEEFAVILPACQLPFAKMVAERIRSAIEATPIPVSPLTHIHTTVSIGGSFALQWVRSTRQLWVERSDQQLYHAKKNGRNRVCIEEQMDSTVSAEEKSLLFAPGLPSPFGWPEPPGLDPQGSVN